MNQEITYNGIKCKFNCKEKNISVYTMNKIEEDFHKFVDSGEGIRGNLLKFGFFSYEVILNKIFDDHGKYDPDFSINIIEM